MNTTKKCHYVSSNAWERPEPDLVQAFDSTAQCPRRTGKRRSAEGVTIQVRKCAEIREGQRSISLLRRQAAQTPHCAPDYIYEHPKRLSRNGDHLREL